MNNELTKYKTGYFYLKMSITSKKSVNINANVISSEKTAWVKNPPYKIVIFRKRIDKWPVGISGVGWAFPRLWRY
jgi:hypothetical protein